MTVDQSGSFFKRWHRRNQAWRRADARAARGEDPPHDPEERRAYVRGLKWRCWDLRVKAWLSAAMVVVLVGGTIAALVAILYRGAIELVVALMCIVGAGVFVWIARGEFQYASRVRSRLDGIEQATSADGRALETDRPRAED